MNDDRHINLRFQEELEGLFVKKPFLFDHGRPYVPLPDYFRHFSWRAPQFFTQFSCPWGYNIAILDQFKDKIAWTSSVMMGDTRQFMTLIQVDPQFHIVGTFGFSRENDCLSINFEILSCDPKRVAEFVTENSKSRLRFRDNTIGLGAMGARNGATGFGS